MKIGEMPSATATKVETVRFYEKSAYCTHRAVRLRTIAIMRVSISHATLALAEHGV